MVKIALWRTVGESYRFLFAHLGWFVRLAGPWLLVAVLAFLFIGISAFLVGGTFALLGRHLVLPLVTAAGGIIAIAAIFGGMTAVAVAWHRAILLDRRPDATPRFGRREWRFLGYTVLITLIAGIGVAIPSAVVAFAAQIAIAAIGPAGKLLYLISVAIIVAGIVLSIRMWLVLPAVAVDESGERLATAWRRGRGNGWRLLLGSFLCAAPVAVLVVVVQAALEIGPLVLAHGTMMSVGGRLAASLLQLALSYVQIVLQVGFLSFSYRQLTGGAAPR